MSEWITLVYEPSGNIANGEPDYPPASARPLLPGWVLVLSTLYPGAMYYQHYDGTTTWERPESNNLAEWQSWEDYLGQCCVRHEWIVANYYSRYGGNEWYEGDECDSATYEWLRLEDPIWMQQYCCE